MAAPKTTVCYFASTHWDREWYQSFQGFRMRLVDVLDDVLDRLENDPEYRCFHLDGQTVPLDDYLEIRPENAERARRLVREGRLLLGPWFVQPDLMLAGGEGLIRNLLLGDREARRHGHAPMKFGYMCDMFGSPAVMPQILAGFGIPAGLTARGTNEHTHPAHFRWRGPDGSELLLFKEQDSEGYGSWRLHVRVPAGEESFDEDRLVELAERFVQYEQARSPGVPLVLAMDGHDHVPAWPAATRALDVLRRRLGQYDWRFGTLEEYAAAMAAHRQSMPVITGELRDTARGAGGTGFLFLITNTLSSRVPLKQANDALMNLLCHWAEPLALWANLDGAAIPETYLPLAWHHLLLNHPHDSMCGCSIDQVHRDMIYRFDQCRMLAEGVLNRAMLHFAGSTNLPRGPEMEGMRVRLFHALPHERKDVVELDLDFPPDWPTRFSEGFGYEDRNSFRITGADGHDVPYQLLELERNRTVRIPPPSGLSRGHRFTQKVDRHRVALRATLPAMGFATLTVRPVKAFTRTGGTLRTGRLSAANEHLAIGITPDGRLELADRRTGRTFRHLLGLEDVGEIGDGWFHVSPVNDRAVSGGWAAAGCVHEGPLSVTFRIDRRLPVPEAMDPGPRRSERTVELHVRHTLTLRAGSPLLEIVTRIENAARNHRLQLLLPTGIQAAEYFVDEPFGLIRRHTGIDPATAEWREPEIPEKSMWSLAGIHDDTGGLALISGGGLKEIAAFGDADGTLALTLLRAYARTVATDGEPGGQLAGPLEVRYALTTLAGAPDAAELLALRDALQTGVRWLPSAIAPDVPADGSFCRFDNPRVRLSSLKRAEDGGGAILRVYNPSPDPQALRARFGRVLKAARPVNLNEEPVDGPPGRVEGDVLALEIPPRGIVTVRIEWS